MFFTSTKNDSEVNTFDIQDSLPNPNTINSCCTRIFKIISYQRNYNSVYFKIAANVNSSKIKLFKS